MVGVKKFFLPENNARFVYIIINTGEIPIARIITGISDGGAFYG